MKLLSYTIPRTSHWLERGTWFTPAMLTALFGLEWLGRRTESDVFDLVGAGALVAIILTTLWRHRRQPLGWIQRLEAGANYLSRRCDGLKFELGIDLRGTPHIRPRLPLAMILAQVALIVGCGAALALWSLFPAGWRAAAIHGSYVIYLAGVIGVWTVMFLACFGGILVPVLVMGQYFPRTGDKLSDLQRLRRFQFGVVASYVLMMTLALWTLPLWVSPIFVGVLLVGLSLATLFPSRAEIQFIWRPRGTNLVFAVPTRYLLLTFAILGCLFLEFLTLVAIGGPILGHAGMERTMPVMYLLGVVLAWISPGFLLGMGAGLAYLWQQSPSRETQPSLHVSGPLVSLYHKKISALALKWGWAVKYDPQPPESIDVRVKLVVPEQSDATEFDPSWPLKVSFEDLEAGRVVERFERREVIQKRRLLLKGFERLFRFATNQEYQAGCGFWLAPHLWFLTGLTRDDAEQGEGEDASYLTHIIGPPYHMLFHRAVRQYLYRTLRDLQVDLLFVEDGVGYRRLARVMRTLFELHDRQGATKPVEEIQFRDLTKVKVIIHDFQLDEPYVSERYPEPRFEDLGRARIMHIFRDRGDSEELLPQPFDFTRDPAPLYFD